MQSEHKVNILLVDDSPKNLLALEAVLHDLGQTLVTATSGEEALRHLLERDFAAVLLDVHMPGMDGFETAALIREREKLRRTPIIFLTAVNTTETHVSRGYSLGAVDYLFKPIVPEIVRGKVAVFVDMAVKERERQLARDRARELEKEREKERAVALQTADLARSNAELEQFAYVISHDLKEPLRMVASYVKLLAEEYQGKLDAEADKYIRYAIGGVTRMRELIDDLLTLSRVGRSDGALEPIDLQQVIDQVVVNLEGAIQEAGARVEVGPMPTVVGHRSGMIQLFQNLIGNAVKFRGELQPLIEISADQQGDIWQVTVEDNGIGIDPEYHERIFRVFQRLHARDEYPGTGIGLAICKKVVEWHGGRIRVDSEPGKGTSFHITLPKEHVVESDTKRVLQTCLV
jgi:two-component system sensor histidine kinase/response regulator